MPRKKDKRNAATDLEKARARAKNAQKYISQISDDFIKKANAGKLSQEQFSKAVEALRKVASNPHITGITSTTPKFSIETVSGSDIVIKISIGTTKTRKTFSVRSRL
jgi:hypothetical protein